MNWSAGVMTGLMEMARGRGKDNAGGKESRGCEISGCMEDKRDKVI